ncbi:MAG TPA: gliding motility-associated C-terminal domain-containing protein [Ferruginibacter sp.]|nr:gliding motility-associated C-terminal domain-containing protein [Ferruginibacter sp.]
MDEIININALIEGRNGDFLINIGYSNPNYGSGNFTLFNAMGNVLWSNTYWGNLNFAAEAVTFDQRNNKLNIWGEVSLNSGENCLLTNKTKFLSLFELDYFNGNLTNQRNYCATNNSRDLYLEFIGHPFQKNLIAFPLKNGKTILINQFRRTSKYLCLMLFDESKNFIKASYFTLENSPSLPVHSLPYFECTINEFSGDILFSTRIFNSFTNIDYGYSFITLLNNNLDKTKQLYLQNNTSDLFTVGPLYLQNRAINFVINSKYSINPHLFQLNYSHTLPNALSEAFCETRDTTFGSFETYNLVDNPYTISFDSIYRNVYQFDGTPGFTISSANFTSSTTCIKYSICDSLTLQGSQTACSLTDTFTYTAYKNPQCLKNIEWSTDTSFVEILQTNKDSLQVRFKKTGSTTIYASLAGCILKDSIQVSISNPKTRIDILSDSLICPGENKVLKATNGFANYEWSTGSINDSAIALIPGWYFVTATDSCGNRFKDSLHLQMADTALSFLQYQTICNNDTLKIKLPSYVKNIVPVPNEDVIVLGNNLHFFPQQNSNYTLQIEFNGGCRVTKNLQVKVEYCPETVFVPNSFTPNNDGLNDRFKPIFGRQPAQYYFAVYNRFGQRVFETNNPLKAWDGTFKSAEQATATYTWQCSYAFANKPKKSLKGTVVLIR